MLTTRSPSHGHVETSAVARFEHPVPERTGACHEGIANSVPMPAITASLFARFVSRQDDSPAMKAVAALRNQFGGHAVKAAEASPRIISRRDFKCSGMVIDGT